MKILFIGTGAYPIGPESTTAVEIVIENLAKEMKRLGHEICIMDIEDDQITRYKEIKYQIIKMPGFLRRKFTKSGSIMHIIKKLIFCFKVINVSRKLNKKENFDAIHIQNQYPGFFMLFFKKFIGNPCFVYTSHTSFWTLPIEEFNKKYYYKTLMERICIKKADKIVTVGYSQKKGIIEKTGVDESKIEVIQNGVDLVKFHNVKRKTDKIVFLNVAKIEKRKNQLLVIQSIPEIIKKNKDVEFRFAGQIEDKEYYCEINDFIIENKIEKYVKILGPIKNNKIPEEYQKADVYISASIAEGLPLTVLEAMASGCAILISDIGPHKEIMKDNEILFFKNNNKDITEKLKKIISDKNQLEKLKAKALNSAKKNYSWTEVAKKNLKFYTKVCRIK